MVVKLKVDQFTAGDMVFSVRRRFRPTTSYYNKFYPSGDLTLDALNELKLNETKKSRYIKSSDEYYNVKQEAESDNLDNGEYIIESIKKDVKEKVEDNIKQDISGETESTPKTFLEALTAAYTRNAPSDSIRRSRKSKLPELTIDQKTLDDYFKQKPTEITPETAPKPLIEPKSISIDELMRRRKEYYKSKV